MQNVKLIQILKDIGLTGKEAKVYISLLELNEALPSSIARKTHIKRPTVYNTLEQLQKKGFITHIKKGLFKKFRAIDPRSLIRDHEKKHENLKQALPTMLNLHKRFEAIPQMSVYEGKEGLIQIMEDTLTTSTELLCWANISLAANTVLKDYYPTYIEKKVAKKVPLRGVFCYDKTAIEFKKRGDIELREIYTIPKHRFPFKNEINIYDDKVAIISHQDEVGVIIQNQNIADTQRAIFELGFEYAKLLERDLLTDEDREYLGMPVKKKSTKNKKSKSRKS